MILQIRICALCGDPVEHNIDGCHVKSKSEFSADQIADKEDRHMNIINLYKKHHNLFDGNIAMTESVFASQLNKAF